MYVLLSSISRRGSAVSGPPKHWCADLHANADDGNITERQKTRLTAAAAVLIVALFLCVC